MDSTRAVTVIPGPSLVRGILSRFRSVELDDSLRFDRHRRLRPLAEEITPFDEYQGS
jgi:hypothetical protein